MPSPTTANRGEKILPYVKVIYDFRWFVVIFGLITSVIAVVLAIGSLSDLNSSGGSVPGSSSELAEQRISDNLLYPEYSVMVLLTAPSNDAWTIDHPNFKTATANVVAALTGLNVKGVVSYYDYPEQEKLLSDDKRKMIVIGNGDTDDIDNEDLRKAVRSAVSGTSIKAIVSGAAVVSNDISFLLFDGLERAEISTIPVVIVLLFLTCGGLVAGLLPWAVCISTICWSLGIVVGLNNSFRIGDTATTVITMFGVGLGIDYSIFVLTRFKVERLADPDIDVVYILDRVVRTSGRTISFSAITVFLSLLGALGFHQYYLVSLCISVMIVALCTCLSANTILIATMGILDHRVFYGSFTPLWLRLKGKIFTTQLESAPTQDPEKGEAVASTVAGSPAGGAITVEDTGAIEQRGYSSDSETSGIFYTIGSHVTKNPWPHFIWSLSFLIAFCVVCLTKLRFGATGPKDLPNTLDGRKVYDVLQMEFSKYGESRLYVYLETAPGQIKSTKFLTQLSTFTNRLRQTEGVSNVIDMLRPGDYPYTESQWINFYQTSDANTLEVANPLGITNLNDATLVHIASEYYDFSRHAKRQYEEIRDILAESFKDTDGSSILTESGVCGVSATITDLYDDILETMPAWIIVMFITIFLLLLVMTGSVTIPVKAVLFGVASLGANLGLIALIFGQDGPYAHEGVTGYVDGTNIIFICALTFSLSVDYEIFIISQIQEIYYEIGDTREAIARALQRSGRLITSAAIMLSLVTAAFLASELYFIRMIGIGIAMAVLLDATIVRMVLVPSTMTILGDWCWYCPGPIKRLVDYLGLQEAKEVKRVDVKTVPQHQGSDKISL